MGSPGLHVFDVIVVVDVVVVDVVVVVVPLLLMMMLSFVAVVVDIVVVVVDCAGSLLTVRWAGIRGAVRSGIGLVCGITRRC